MLGHEDLNDHDELRKDKALQASIGRLEAGRADCGRWPAIMDSQGGSAPRAGDAAPRAFDTSGVRPRRPLMVRLRSAAHDAAAGLERDLEWLLERLRKAWPRTRIIVRTDAGFCREQIMALCEGQERVDYVLGLGSNGAAGGAGGGDAAAREERERTQQAARRFLPVPDAGELVAGRQGGSTVFVVTTLRRSTSRRAPVRSARGNVKEHKVHLFSKRCSRHANTLRPATFALPASCGATRLRPLPQAAGPVAGGGARAGADAAGGRALSSPPAGGLCQGPAESAALVAPHSRPVARRPDPARKKRGAGTARPLPASLEVVGTAGLPLNVNSQGCPAQA